MASKQYTVLAATHASEVTFTVEADSEPEMHYSVKQKVANWLAVLALQATALTRVDVLREVLV